jgi:hypothetical protein
MLIDELIERAFCDGYEYALEEQKEFTGALTMMNKGRFNSQTFNNGGILMQTPQQFKNYVTSATGDYSAKRVIGVANRNRNNSLGARTVSQVNNIANNHAMRITPTRQRIIESAVKNRENASVSSQNFRQRQTNRASSLTGLVNGGLY